MFFVKLRYVLERRQSESITEMDDAHGKQNDPNSSDSPAGMMFTGLTWTMLGESYGLRQMATGFSSDFFHAGGVQLSALNFLRGLLDSGAISTVDVVRR